MTTLNIIIPLIIASVGWAIAFHRQSAPKNLEERAQHILSAAANHTSREFKFYTRNRKGDKPDRQNYPNTNNLCGKLKLRLKKSCTTLRYALRGENPDKNIYDTYFDEWLLCQLRIQDCITRPGLYRPLIRRIMMPLYALGFILWFFIAIILFDSFGAIDIFNIARPGPDHEETSKFSFTVIINYTFLVLLILLSITLLIKCIFQSLKLFISSTPEEKAFNLTTNINENKDELQAYLDQFSSKVDELSHGEPNNKRNA